MSQIRQNFHEDCEAGINKQINMELFAHYTYLSMANYFERDDVALKGFAKFFHKSSLEEREHAQKLMTYQNKRGGSIVLHDIEKPSKADWGTGLNSMEAALDLEKQVNAALLELHKIASKHEDAHLTNFLEEHYLEEQVEAIKELGDYVTNLKRVGPGLGEYMFDQETFCRE